MNTVFLSWEAFQPHQLRMIEINDRELTLIYQNDAQVDLAFADMEQLDRFVGRLVGSLIHAETDDRLQWN